MNNLSKTLVAAAVFATAGLAFAQTDLNNSGSNDPSHMRSAPAARDLEFPDGMSREQGRVRATPDVSTQRDSVFDRSADRMNSRNRIAPNDYHMSNRPVD